MITRIGGRHLIYIIMCLLSFSPARALAGNPADYEVVPLPQSIVMQKGEPFILEAGVEILATADLQQEAEFLKQYLKEVTWNDLPIVQKRTAISSPSARRVYLFKGVLPQASSMAFRH